MSRGSVISLMEPVEEHTDECDPSNCDISHAEWTKRHQLYKTDWTVRTDDRIGIDGKRIYPEGSHAMMYDAYVDWILFGPDTQTFQEWQERRRRAR